MNMWGDLVSKKRSISTIAGLASSILLVLAPAAHADDPSWTSYWDNAPVGKESRMWTESQYTEINYDYCYTNWRDVSTHVLLWQARDYQPDPTFGDRRFTDCFSGADGDWRSTGTWSGLEWRKYYFSVSQIDDSAATSLTLDVAKIYVDTTKAD
jgi:hypothetical protein